MGPIRFNFTPTLLHCDTNHRQPELTQIGLETNLSLGVAMLRLLTQVEAARLLRLSERTLERLRLQGGGPLYVKAGRAVRYRESDLEEWIDARVVSSTSAIGDER